MDDHSKHDKAILAYEAILARDPGDVRTMLKLGDLLLHAGRPADALAWYERAGRQYEADGFLLKARAICTQIIEICRERAGPGLGARLAEFLEWEIALMEKLGVSPPSRALPDTLARLRREANAPANDVCDVESVFQQFRADVAAQISESDASTRYDLGAAYKEMGLLTDAVSEFELAGRDPRRECGCQWMIGMIHREQGDIDGAISAFIRGLHAREKTPDQELALTYEIGDCYEARRSRDQALYYFQRVARLSPTYADPRGTVAQRIARLGSPDDVS